MALIPRPRRLVLGVVGVALALAGAEAAARLLPPPWPVWTAAAEPPVRVLALGDTATFGLHVEPQEAYPAQLERLWTERRMPVRPIEVVNAGVPGASSATLRRDYRRLVDAVRPDVVTVMIGSTDFFTEVEPRSDAGASRPRSRLLQRLRAGAGAPFELEFDAPDGFPPLHGSWLAAGERFDLGWTRKAERPDPDWRASLRANLHAIADESEAAGVGLVVLTYPAPKVAFVSDAIRAAMQERAVPLADVAQALQPICPSSACPDVYVDQQHPTRAGHELVARSLLSTLRTTPWVQEADG